MDAPAIILWIFAVAAVAILVAFAVSTWQYERQPWIRKLREDDRAARDLWNKEAEDYFKSKKKG